MSAGNKKAKWVHSKFTLAGLPVSVLCLGDDGINEWALQLKKGEIYSYSKTEFGCWVHGARAANRCIIELGLTKKLRSKGEELLFQFPKDPLVLEKVISILGRPKKVKTGPYVTTEEISQTGPVFGEYSKDIPGEGGGSHE